MSTKLNMTPVQFASQAADILNGLMEVDMIDQNDLFEMQEKFTELIATGANARCSVAKVFVKKWPTLFYTEEAPVKS
tara:strand:- start:196 stop:426 length:231 start_codon:yes stop_codon:yes gene_type:complete